MIFPRLPFLTTKAFAMATALLAPASGVFAEPSKSDIRAGLNDYLDARNARVVDFDFKVFDGTEAGSGRVAVEGTIAYREPLGRVTPRRAFYPEAESKPRAVIAHAADLPGEEIGYIWERVVEIDEPVAFSGSMNYIEGVSSFDWDISVDIDLPDGRIRRDSRLEDGDYIEPSARYDEAKEILRRFEQTAGRIQENFVRQVGKGIAGQTFHHMNQCDDILHYEIHFDEERLGVEIGGPEDTFRTDVMLGGELIIRRPDRFPFEWHEPGEQIEFRRPVTLELLYSPFTGATAWATTLDSEWFYRDGSEFKETTYYNFHGRWRNHRGADGFFNPRLKDECAVTAIVRQ